VQGIVTDYADWMQTSYWISLDLGVKEAILCIATLLEQTAWPGKNQNESNN
jgi:hypothetical protein